MKIGSMEIPRWQMVAILKKKLFLVFLHSLGSTKCIEQKTIDFV
jgi:hypothetical protein